MRQNAIHIKNNTKEKHCYTYVSKVGFIVSIKEFFSKRKQPVITYNPETHYPVIRSSICTGEQVAGFKCKETGRFTEIMLIKGEKDLNNFKSMYNLGDVKKEY